MSAATITESAIRDWLTARAESYGIAGLSIRLSSRSNDPAVIATAPKPGTSYSEFLTIGGTIDEAVAEIHRQLAAYDPVADLRRTIQAAEREIAAIEKTKPTAAHQAAQSANERTAT